MAQFSKASYPPQPTGFKSGKITVGVVAAAGPDVKVAQTHYITLQAAEDNTVAVFVGDSGITVGEGTELAPGGGLMVAVNNISKLYFIASAADQTVYYACEIIA